MEKQISNISLLRLPNETHLQFMNNVLAILEKPEYAQVKTALGTVYNSFATAFAAEDLANEKIRKSAYTEQINKLDAFRDALHHALGTTLAAYAKSTDTDEAEAARQLKIIYDNYGSVTKNTMLQETGIITSMLQDINAATDFLDALNLTPIVDKLGSINSTLNDLMLDRNVETADKEAVGTVPDARLNSDSAYHRLTSAVELAAFTAVPAVQTVINNFIDVLNSLVEQFKRVIAGKEAKNSSGSNEIEEEVVIVE